MDGFYELYRSSLQSALKKYGPKTVVCMQKGTFFNIYDFYDEDMYTSSPSPSPSRQFLKIVKSTHLKQTQDNNNKPPSNTNPFMIGCPVGIIRINRHLGLLHESGYTIVIYTETEKLKKGFKRELTEVISPGFNMTLDDGSALSNTIIVFYIDVLEYFPDKNINLIPMNIGMSSIDVNTGESTIHEAFSISGNVSHSIQETSRFFLSYKPKEVLLCVINVPLSEKEIFSKKFSKEIGCCTYKNIKDVSSESHNSRFLKKVYSQIFTTPNRTIFDVLGMSKFTVGVCAFVNLLETCMLYSKSILDNIPRPRIHSSLTRLELNSTTIEQLDIPKLLQIIRKTKTPMGNREFNRRILSPFIRKSTINRSYDLIEKYITLPKDKLMQLQRELSKFPDIDKIHRLISINKTTPSLIVEYYSCIKHIREYYSQDIMITGRNNERYMSLLDELEKELSIINVGVLQNSTLKVLMPDYDGKIRYSSVPSGGNRTYSEGIIDFSPLSREIPFTNVDCIRYASLYNKLDSFSKKYNLATIDYDSKNNEILFIVPKNIKGTYSNVVKLGSNYKISDGELNVCCRKLLEEHARITRESYDAYYHIVGTISKYELVVNKLVKNITLADVTISAAIISLRYGYHRPVISDDEDDGTIVSTNLRHPIVERINTREKYIPNNVSVSSQSPHLLVYGVNMCGKTTYTKSIGLAIVLAQAGFYVPAETFKFKIYNKILTRMSGNDDLIRGKSSYHVELDEMRTMYDANQQTLILGDELCRGTDYDSGVALTCALIDHLISKNATFVFSTHMHNILQYISLDKINVLHFSVDKDTISKRIIWNRHLQPGHGNSNYGILVAEEFGFDEKIISLARDYLSKIQSPSSAKIPKKSRYNSELIVEECENCKSTTNLHVHHIIPQREFNEFGSNGVFHKNNLHNLSVLCEKCHISHHHPLKK